MESLRGSDLLRALFSLGAACVAMAICFVQDDVHIVLTEPATYASPLHHRCGELMLGCLAWAVYELMRSFRTTTP